MRARVAAPRPHRRAGASARRRSGSTATAGEARAVRVRAFAKINLALRVVGVRADGYHELLTTFQSLALHDTLTFTVVRGPFHIACDDPACPVDRTNLVWRAADEIWRAAGRRGEPGGVRVHIEKRIPLAAGLGGGSSDAAASLRALSSLWGVELGEDRLRRIAAGLGADVPYFLEGGTALGVGRGDVLFPLIDWPASWIVLLLPDFGVSTVDAFRWFDRQRARGERGGAARKRPRGAGRRPAPRDRCARRRVARGGGLICVDVGERLGRVRRVRRSGVGRVGGRPAEGSDPASVRHPHADARRLSSPRPPGVRGARSASLGSFRLRSLSVDKQATCRRINPSYTLTVCATRRRPLLTSASSNSARYQTRLRYGRRAADRAPGACNARPLRSLRGARAKAGAPGEDDGAWPSGKARDFGSRIRRFESFRPSQFASRFG